MIALLDPNIIPKTFYKFYIKPPKSVATELSISLLINSKVEYSVA